MPPKNPDTEGNELIPNEVLDAAVDTEGNELIPVEKDGQRITVNRTTLDAHKRIGWKEV